MKKNYSDILKRAIKDSGMTQKQIADKLGESQQNLSNWTNKNDISLYNFVRICEAINVNPADLLDKNRQGERELDPRIVRIMKNISRLEVDDQYMFFEHMETALKMILKNKQKKD